MPKTKTTKTKRDEELKRTKRRAALGARAVKKTGKKPAKRRRDKPEHMVWWEPFGVEAPSRLLELPPRALVARHAEQPLGVSEVSATAAQWLYLMECRRSLHDDYPPRIGPVPSPSRHGDSPAPVSVCPVALAFLKHWSLSFASDEQRTRAIGPLLGRLLDTRANAWVWHQRAATILAWYLDEHRSLLTRAAWDALVTRDDVHDIYPALDDARKILNEAEQTGATGPFSRACRALEKPIADAAFFARWEVAKAKSLPPTPKGELHVPWALDAVEACLGRAIMTGRELGWSRYMMESTSLLRDLRWLHLDAIRLASPDPGYLLQAQQIRESAGKMLDELYDPIPF